MPIQAPFWGFFWGHIPPNDVTHRPNPQKDILGLNHVIWAINRKNRSRGSSWALVREKKDRTGKKSQKRNISPICEKNPTEAMYMKSCLEDDVLDVITCAKFQNEIFRGYDFTGDRIFHFYYWFWMGLNLQQCSATALPMIHLFTWFKTYIHQISSYASDHFSHSSLSPLFFPAASARMVLWLIDARGCWGWRWLTPSPYISHYISPSPYPH